MRWPLLQSGDAVSVVAPSGPFDAAAFDQGLAALRELELIPRFDPAINSSQRYLAGSDARRTNELYAAFDDATTKAVFSARGGYGAMRLLPQLDLARISKKPLLGFSDITALHLALNTRGVPTIHAPVVTQLGRQPHDVKRALQKLLVNGEATALRGAEPIKAGQARGLLLGGNLSVLTRLIGTPFLPSLRGAILLIEDIGERPYRLDRMLTHLKLAGLLDGLAGVAVGELTGCEEKEANYSASDIVREMLSELSCPSAIGFCVGHGDVNFPLVLGAPASLDATTGTLSPSGLRELT